MGTETPTPVVTNGNGKSVFKKILDREFHIILLVVILMFLCVNAWIIPKELSFFKDMMNLVMGAIIGLAKSSHDSAHGG